MTALGVPDPDDVLRPLFAAARSADEFEFCCALLRIRGAEDAGWDPTSESFQLIQQVASLVQAPLDKQLAFRLTLFLYSHVTEMDDLYRVPGNMLRIVLGERYTLDPLRGLPVPAKLDEGQPLSDDVLRLVHLATKSGMPNVGKLCSTFYVRQVRNAFSHSDYALGPKSFNMRRGERLKLDGMLESAIPYEWLVPRLELGINTALALFGLILESARSYKDNKVVKGRFSSDSSYVDIELTTAPTYGLTGFRAPPPTTP